MSRKETEQYYNRVVTAALRIGFVALLFVMADFVLRPFLMMIIWGIIIAIGIYPLFKKLSRLLGGRDKLASALITLTALALIIVPSVFVLVPTVNSVQELAQKAQSDELTVPPPSPEVAKWPVIGQSVYGIWEGAAEDLRATVKTFQPQIREMVTKIAQKITGVGATVLISIFSFIIAGLLLLQAKPAEEVTHRIFRLLIGEDEAKITELSKLTIRSVVQGILGIASIQAIAALVLMLIFGIPLAGLWSLLVLFVAVIQLPPALILVPVAIYGFGDMGTTKAVIFLILAIAVSVSDALLKPLLLGRGVDVPMLVVLLGAIGGMIVFGVIGLFVGAVILAMAYRVFGALIDKTVWIK